MQKATILFCILLLFLFVGYSIFSSRTSVELYRIAREERNYFLQEQAIDSSFFEGPSISYTIPSEVTYIWHYREIGTVTIAVTVPKQLNLAHGTSITLQGSKQRWDNLTGSAWRKR